jgi:tryptophan synthase alpha subunit
MTTQMASGVVIGTPVVEETSQETIELCGQEVEA